MGEIELPEVEELEEQKGKSFTRKVAFTTACYAVALAITALGGSNAMKEMLLAQQQASNQWAYYQAKVLREHNYRSQRMRAELDLLEKGNTLKPEVKAKYEAYIKHLGEEERRFNQEKKDIEREARKLEHERDVNRDKDPYFDFAEVMLQIAIVMASVAILSGARFIFLISLVFAGVGGLLSLNGFTLLVRLPFFHS